MRRLLFIQLWLRSTTQRLAGTFGSRFASSPRERICGVIPQKDIAQRSHLASYPLSKQRCTSDSTRGRSTGILSIVDSTRVMSFSLAAPTASPTGMPFVSVSKLLLTPFLPRSVGLGPLFFPTERSFCHGSVHRQPRPIDTFGLVILKKALFPKTMEKSLFCPVLKAPMGGAAWTDSCSIQGIPLTAGVQHEKDSVENNTIRFGFSTALSRMRILSGRNPWLNLLPKLIRNTVTLFRHGLPSQKRVSPWRLTTSTV